MPLWQASVCTLISNSNQKAIDCGVPTGGRSWLYISNDMHIYQLVQNVLFVINSLAQGKINQENVPRKSHIKVSHITRWLTNKRISKRLIAVHVDRDNQSGPVICDGQSSTCVLQVRLYAVHLSNRRLEANIHSWAYLRHIYRGSLSYETLTH